MVSESPRCLWWTELSRQANGGMTHWCRQTKHVTCTAAVVDMVMGAVGGLLVVQHQSWITHFVQRMVRMLTNDILHTGCIWLMGMPAGFKDDDSSQPEWGQFGCM
jgi:phosphatidylinositol glycan class Q protein